MPSSETVSLRDLARAIYTVNRHAKTAPEPQHLYFIKKETIKQLLKEKRAKKSGCISPIIPNLVTSILPS